MNNLLNSPFLVPSVLLGIALSLILYSLLVPKSNRHFDPESREKNKFIGFLSAISDQVFTAMPAQFDNIGSKKNPKIENLIVKSGNPWELTAEEFLTARFLTAFIGLVASVPTWYIVSINYGIPYIVFLVVFTAFGFFYPYIKYSEQASKRNLDFTRELPEALDLMRIAMSSGDTFISAMRNVIPRMEDGVLKYEFEQLRRNVDSGKTLSEALEILSKRSPNDGISSFVRAVQTANETNTPISEILDSRATESREEFFSLLREKTARLPEKTLAVLSPTMMIALMILVISPSASGLSKIF